MLPRAARSVGPRLLALALCSLCATDARAINREVFKEVRDRYEGPYRLRVDLKAAGRATDPNVVGLAGVGYPSERSPILFGALETVYVERITNEGATRLGLTVYRSKEEADRLRASVIPAPAMANPNFGRTVAAFAQQSSTSVILELKAGKKDAEGQRAEIETLLDKVFYLRSDPTREELEYFVRHHAGWPITRLRALTGLPEDEVRALVEAAAAPAGTPARHD